MDWKSAEQHLSEIHFHRKKKLKTIPLTLKWASIFCSVFSTVGHGLIADLIFYSNSSNYKYKIIKCDCSKTKRQKCCITHHILMKKNAEFENYLAVLTMVKALHHSCVSHELLFHTLKELAAIKYFCKAGHPADLHQSKQCLKDSSMTPLHQWKAFQ